MLYGTTHYYRYYVKQGDTYTYGEVYSLKTETVTEIARSMDNIQRNRAPFKGNVKFSEPNEIQIGVQYYPKSASHRNISIVNRIADNGDFSLEISDLSFGTEYYWEPVLIQNGKTFSVGRLQEFYVVAYNMSDAVDLSSSGCANCYIISQKGVYKLKTVKGNSNDTVGDVAICDVLWESFGTSTIPNKGDLISNISHEGGYIAFQTEDNFKEGNAVIAARDADGEILWSWHLWLTDQPQEQIYYHNAGIIMDRNLGAISATPGVGALGLLYQWGRKDPFLGSSSIDNNILAKSTLSWPSSVSTSPSTGTVDYVTSHPTTYINGTSSTYDWHYSSSDNTLWTTSDKDKSIYDPCPAGWRVPDEGVWSKALGESSAGIYYNHSSKGINFSGKLGADQYIWYPASGERYYRESDSLNQVGTSGHYWSATLSYHDYAKGMLFTDGDYIATSYGFFRSNGSSIRCMKE